MDALALSIEASMAAEPNNFTAREPLWMERENLRAQLTEEAAE